MQAKALMFLTLATLALAAPSEEKIDVPKDKRSLLESGYGYGHAGVSATFAAPAVGHGGLHATFGAPPLPPPAAAGPWVGGQATFAAPPVDLVAPAPLVSHNVHTNTIVTKHVPVGVPQPFAVPIEKHIPYPVIQKVAVPVDRPYPVAVPRPYPVPVHIPIVKHVAAPYPVKVAVPIIKHVPYAIHTRPIIVEKFSSSGWNW